MHLIIYTDGGARGNPGPAGIGVVIYQEKGDGEELVEEFGEYIGEATNNVAEYSALLAAIKRAREIGATSIDFMMDSELVVKQMRREYRVKDENLAILFTKVWNEAIHFKKVTFTHIPREKNKQADKMVNLAIDRGC
ncbi:MAG: ribonuclease HI family protein [bacterium]|nr:ribonuclease HI family protein [bacterium]